MTEYEFGHLSSWAKSNTELLYMKFSGSTVDPSIVVQVYNGKIKDIA